MRLSQHLMKTMVIEESKESPKGKLYSSPTSAMKNNDADTSLMREGTARCNEVSTFIGSSSNKLMTEALSTTLSSSRLKRPQNPFNRDEDSLFEQPSMFDIRNDDINQVDRTTVGGHTASHL